MVIDDDEYNPNIFSCHLFKRNWEEENKSVEINESIIVSYWFCGLLKKGNENEKQINCW